ncbi:DNA cytosine methyltransferase [Paramicrobacterium fandaimingii]|uniref:DNA cytosine methyltransferase n=1 Tax=Paramicrobacterium fandaimingii TaxID=2708079 RepID=UPI00141E41C4|nr:DNA cytosine methyltransferase [Microbacterium fandaimingii]
MGELFSGPGGMALGAHEAARSTGIPLSHGWANDYDEDTVATYIANIEGALPETVLCQDVRSLDVASLPPINGFAYGFPCNDYSLVGENRGLKGEFGPLFTYGVKVLEHHQPEWFVAENVSGLRSSNGGKDFAHILETLRNAGPGYKLTPHLYRFEDYGVPQRRHRIIVVGIRSDLSMEYRVPAPTHLGPDRWKSASDALADIPANAPNQEATRQSINVVRRLNLIDPGENAFNAKRMSDELRLNVKGATLSQIYKRLRPDRPSYTITGSGGGGTHGYHWFEPRALTNRERARIQTFPDEFRFVGRKESVRRQVGMAVPPEGAFHIFRALFRSILGTEYDSVPANLDRQGIPET